MRVPKRVVEQADAASVWGDDSDFESVSLADLSSSRAGKSVALPLRPPTPHWSENQPWASNLEDINLQCINNINSAVQFSRAQLPGTPSTLSSATIDDDEEQTETTGEEEDEEDEYSQIPLDILDQAFEQVRQRFNTMIDKAKANAIAEIKEIPPHLRKDAAGWFARRLNVVMQFLSAVGNALNKAMQLMVNGVKESWMSIMRSLRIGVARRAVAAAHGVRTLQSVATADAREEGVPLRLL